MVRGAGGSLWFLAFSSWDSQERNPVGAVEN